MAHFGLHHDFLVEQLNVSSMFMWSVHVCKASNVSKFALAIFYVLAGSRSRFLRRFRSDLTRSLLYFKSELGPT